MKDAALIVEKASGAEGGYDTVRRFFVEPGIDSEGSDAFAVTIILSDDDLSGSEAVTIVAALSRRFWPLALIDSDHSLRDGRRTGLGWQLSILIFLTRPTLWWLVPSAERSDRRT